MRLLIDGYNLMHAAGLMARRFGPDGLRRTRHRFLNDLADRLGPDRCRSTTVVFDASTLPLNQAPEATHKGMTVVFAIEDEDADARIEQLIAGDSAPRLLEVVSTDRRIRAAASRRRASAIRSDEFLDRLDASARDAEPRPEPSCTERARLDGPCPAEAAYWAAEFAGLGAEPALDDIPDPAPTEPSPADVPHAGPIDASPSLDDAPDALPDDWTDAEFARIAREVDSEFAEHRAGR